MNQRDNADAIRCRRPTIEDGKAIHEVVRETGVLDVNSCYLYLLLCTDFAETCVVAEEAGRVVGFVTGYRPPGRPDTVFLWQVGVAPAGQGKGLGKLLVHAFLDTPGAADATVLETTISPSNAASQALFRAVARDRGAEVTVSPHFTEDHFPPGHEAEEIYRISPIR